METLRKGGLPIVCKYNIKNMEVSDALIKILEKSHQQAIDGDTLSMDSVERFMEEKIYELTHSMDTNLA